MKQNHKQGKEILSCPYGQLFAAFETEFLGERMKLFLNAAQIELPAPNADLSALNFVREKTGLTGTKEGCASGDCGACTLLVGSFKDGKMTYETVNSCITPIQALEACHVVTVEHLATKGRMHPAQDAMVESHGSQCGFCTPGFIMSLAGLYEQTVSKNETVTRQAVQKAISGNLCRCTGYRPIVDAGLAMSTSGSTQLQDQEVDVLEALQDISDTGLSPNYFRPSSISQLRELMQQYSDASLIAGGTDLMLRSTQLYQDIPKLIDLMNVEELTTITQSESCITIGAAVTYSQLERFFNELSPELSVFMDRIASTQIRNRGTIGGNIANASPIADLPPILIAMGAKITISSVDGTEKVIDTEAFYTGYKQTLLNAGEYISKIEIPLSSLQDFHRFYKVSKRIEDDISSVMLAVRFKTKGDTIEKATIAYGGMAATPISVSGAENAFINQPVSSEAALNKAMQVVADQLQPMSDVRASADYRLIVAQRLIKKAWLELNGVSLVNLAHDDV